MRNRLADPKSTATLADAAQLLDELENRYSTLSDIEMQTLQSSQPEASWYRRHRKSTVHRQRTEQQQQQQPQGQGQQPQSLEERKQIMKERIAKLKASRLEKRR